MRNISGSITAGGVAQTAAPPRAGRLYLLIQNKTGGESFWVAFGDVTATPDSPSIEFTPGASYIFEGEFITTDAISVISATTGTKFTIWEA